MKRFFFWVLILGLFAPFARAQSSLQFTIARLKYAGGGDWYSNATSLPNLLRELRTRVHMETDREESIVEPSDPNLFSFPLVYMNGHGTVRFSEADVVSLREYVRRGGVLWADDNYGMDESFRKELLRVLPDHSLVELSFDHPIYSIYYTFDNGCPKIHEHDGGPARLYGIYLDGRIAVLYTFNTDIGDGLESEGVHPEDSLEIREQAMRMAINIVLFVLAG
jgi:hypothetical protein